MGGTFQRKIRVLIAKVGTDGHTRGAMVVAHGLRDAGMEVVFSGLYQTPEQVVQAAMQEDVDVVGVSHLDGAHMRPISRIAELLHQRGMDEVLLIAGGTIPKEDAEVLRTIGVAAVFTAGTPMERIVDFVWGNASAVLASK